MQPSDIPLVFSVLALLGVLALMFGHSIENERNDKRFRALDAVLMDHLKNDHGIDLDDRLEDITKKRRPSLDDCELEPGVPASFARSEIPDNQPMLDGTWKPFFVSGGVTAMICCPQCHNRQTLADKFIGPNDGLVVDNEEDRDQRIECRYCTKVFEPMYLRDWPDFVSHMNTPKTAG